MKMKPILGIFLVCLFPIYCVAEIYMEYRFANDCGDYIKRASRASTPEQAKNELDIAIDYLNHHGMTNGNTGILFNRPKNDVGFWYRNLVGHRKEMEIASQSSSQLERSNALMRLRESLRKTDKEGREVVVAPSDIELHPSVVFWYLLLIMSSIGSLVGGLMIFSKYENYH